MLNYLSKSVPPKAKALLHEIGSVEHRFKRLGAFDRLAELFAGVRFVDGVPENACQIQEIEHQQIAA